MSSRITVFPHPLTADREVLIVEPGTTLRKAITTALPKIRIEYLSVYQNGKRVSDIDTPVADDAFFLARMEPQGAAGQIVGGIASIMLGVILTATGIGAGIGGYLIWGGVGLIATGLVTGEAERNSAKAKKSLSRPGLSGGGNSANPNGKVPWIFGTHLITPYYGAAPYTSIGGTDGEQEYLHMLFVVGYGKLALSNFKLGTKLLATNLAAVMDGDVAIDGNFSDSNVSLEIQQSGSIPALYDASGWTIKETSVDSDLAGFRNSLSNSGISGGELDGLTITVNATNKTIYRSAGNWGTAGVSIGDVITLSGMANAGNNYPMIVTNVSGSTLTCWEATDMVDETHASISATVAPGNIVETAKRVRKISWTIEFPRGLVKWNVNSPTNYSVPVKAYYRQKGGSDGSWIAAPAWTGESGTTITRNKAITMRFTTITADLGTSYTGEYETRVVVEQPQANNDDTYTYFEDCTWASVRTHHGIAPVSSKAADKVVLVAMKIRASYQLQNTIDQFNVIATPVLTRAGAGTDEAYIRALPNNPAASFVHACMDSINPRPRPAASMDFATLRAWADSCAGIGLECNAVISSGSDMRTMLQQIASAGRASFYKKDMLYSVAADFAKATTVAHITPRNAWDFAYTRSFETLPHGFKVPFTNKDQDYESDERIVLGDGYIYDTEEDGVLRDAFGVEHTTSEEYLPGQNYVEATEFEELSLFGVTDKDQAWLMGRYEWESRKYRNTVYSVSMDIEQLVVTLGDKVRFSHPILSQALYSARISGLLYDGSGDVNGVRLDAPVTVAATYGCRIRTPDTSIYRAISNAAGETSSLSFSTVIAIADAPSVGDLVMVGPAGLETEELIVQGVQFNDDYSAQLTLVPYADEVFGPDDDTPPDFYSRIIKAGPTVVERALASDEYARTIADRQTDPVSISGSYSDYLDGLMQDQVDRAITYYTQADDPSTAWTTDALKKEHIGDYWRTSTGAVWHQWSGAAWTEISDPVAQQAADDAQTTADTKVTVWADLATAQTYAEANDLFLASGLLYRCLTALAATYERITPKRWPDGTTLPVAATHEPLLKGDTFYKTDTLQWYVYTTSWEADGPSLKTIPATYSPKNLGRYNAAHPSSHNPGDYWTVYDTDDSPIQRGIWYDNAGTPARISAVSGETGYTTDAVLLAKLSACMADVAWCEKNSYGTAANYGIAMFFESFGAVTAFIQRLFVGSFSIVTTAGGNVFKVLPEHLTASGRVTTSWAPAKFYMTDGDASVLQRVIYKIPCAGYLRVNITCRTIDTSKTLYVRPYKNGSAVGTEHTTSSAALVTFTDDIAVAEGDLLEIQEKISDTTALAAGVTDFYLSIAETPGLLKYLAM